MKMSIIALEYKNIRKIPSLNISFVGDDRTITKNTFIMMGNGTGKTTTITLIKGLLDGTASKWSSEEIRSYKPVNKDVESGSFSMSVRFDDRLFKYILSLDYCTGTAAIETVAPPKGREEGLRLPEALRGIFTPDFVRRFVFDGEQAERTLDSSSNEAEEAIKYLYRLDEFDEILAANDSILSEIQALEGKKGTTGSLNNLKTRQKAVTDTIYRLNQRARVLREAIDKDGNDLAEWTSQRNELDKNYESLNEEKNRILSAQQDNRGKLEVKIAEIVSMVKSPYLLSQSLSDRMYELGACMKKLKLPKTISRDFFTELANAPECVCGRCIGEKERQAILANAEKYLGSDQQSVLNEIKSSLMDSAFDSQLDEAFAELESLREESNVLASRFQANEEKLLKAGGDKAAELQGKIDDLNSRIAVAMAELNKIESKDLSDEQLTEDNNINKAEKVYHYYEEQIASATRTGAALKKKKAIERLVNEISDRSTLALKQEIIRKTNSKLQQVITDDYIEIEEIDGCIKLRQKSGASAGQTLSIAYCFLGTMFEDAELEFPFIIDSPAGSMDLVKRKAVADIVPQVFNQMIAFVTSTEVEQFADQFYSNKDAQYVTIVVNPDTDEVEVHNGIDYFDSYQRDNKEA